MAIEVDVNNVASIRDVSNINTNFQRIQTALEEAVSREGVTPNHMNADFDLNNQDLLNGGDIQSESVDTITLEAEEINVDTLNAENILLDGRIVSDLLLEGPPGPQGDQGEQGEPGEGVPVGGTIGQVLTKVSSTDYDTQWSEPAVTVPFTAASASGPASLDFAEDTDNGTNKIKITAPSSVASDKTQTLIDVTGTLVAIDSTLLPVVDNRLVRFDSTTGKIQPSLLEVDDSGNIVSAARFIGPVSQTATGTDRIDIGVESGTPRIVIENGGLTTWMIDSDVSGLFRWFTPGVVQMQLASGSVLTLNQATAEINLGNATDTTITRLAAGEVGVESKRFVWNTAPVTKTADFTVAVNESHLINNKSGSSCTVTLPAASSFSGREITIKNMQAQTVVSASSNVVPRNSTSAGTAILASGAGNWATLVSDGTNWVIMQGS